VRIRGGRPRPYKKPSRLSAKKQYKIYYHNQLEAGMAPGASGKWISNNDIYSQKIKEVYQKQFGMG
jgi:hypothetical protein